MLGTSWKCCLCIYQLHQRGGRVGGWCLCVRKRVGGWWWWWWGLSEAHNLIIQSIEQHIYFIVLQISPNSLGSSEALRTEQSCRWDLQNDQPRVLLIPFLFNTLHCEIWWNGFSSEHHLSLAFQDDMKMTQTWRGRCLVEMFWAVRSSPEVNLLAEDMW